MFCRSAVPHVFTCLIAIAILATLAGCASSPKTAGLARDAFAAGDLDTARQTLAEIEQEKNKLSDAAALDLAMVQLASGDAHGAEKRLRELRDRFDRQPGIAPVREAAAIVTDDLSRAFRPAGYEQVMIRAMLAVCSLAGDATDAESYSLQATRKQSQLAESAKQRGIVDVDEFFQPVAVAPYLRGVLREATHRDYDDAARAYQLVSAVRPEFGPINSDIARATGGVHSQPGHGVLYVIGCVGRGPVLQETTAPTTTAALAIAGQLLNDVDEDEDRQRGRSRERENVSLPNVASVKIPQVVVPPSNIGALMASVGRNHLGVTDTLTDVVQLAQNQVNAEMPWTIARAVVRRVAKEAAVNRVGKNLGLEGSAASIFQFAAGSAWSSTEKADTRCWGMLPREIQVLRAELPAGVHQIDLTPLGFEGQPIGMPKTHTVEISDGRNHYLVAIAPDARIHLVSDARASARIKPVDRVGNSNAGFDVR